MKPLVGASLVWLALLLGACGYRENGESCWSDDQCVSDYCSWGGRCEPGLLELIASLFESEPRRPPPPPARAAYVPPPPPCFVMNEAECRATLPCDWTAICLDDPASPSHPDAGVFACTREYQQTLRCPEGCTLFGSCF